MSLYVTTDTMRPTWKLDDGRVIRLLSPGQLRELAHGTELFDIFGERAVVGVDKIDDDTRGGWLAYGELVR